MIKAIVFDFDGVILDSERIMYLVTQNLFHRYKVELPLSIWSQAIGTQHGFDSISYLEEHAQVKIDRKAFREERNALFNRLVDEEEVLPGVRSILEQAKALGMKIGLATSSRGDWPRRHLKRFGLSDYFMSIKSWDDVQRVKPDPALYLQSLESLDVAPKEAIAIEDSFNGSLAAKRAGMYCIVVPNAVTKQMPFGHVDGCFNSLQDVSLDKLIRYFSSELRAQA
ncbi:HAD family hydrolase [Sporolactobacillus sp. CPB3-1]|uniref:HAD family hydrolase n=1 Tax=Sporolactobacillus mangiferae TaxID=2940498 RepID=A0ABT0M7A0_9BACL|nr:HAD family hydrolase [Sporolactobacillus mangiferae]MCL1630737.1 HAD family hydrolase [Sporolactobacillus mangiferae]